MHHCMCHCKLSMEWPVHFDFALHSVYCTLRLMTRGIQKVRSLTQKNNSVCKRKIVTFQQSLLHLLCSWSTDSIVPEQFFHLLCSRYLHRRKICILVSILSILETNTVEVICAKSGEWGVQCLVCITKNVFWCPYLLIQILGFILHITFSLKYVAYRGNQKHPHKRPSETSPNVCMHGWRNKSNLMSAKRFLHCLSPSMSSYELLNTRRMSQVKCRQTPLSNCFGWFKWVDKIVY